MSQCGKCGTPSHLYNPSCDQCGTYQHVHGQNNPVQPYYPVPYVPVHPSACTQPDPGCGLVYSDSGPARPITAGTYQALCPDGSPSPYAKITVTYAGTNTLAPLYRHPSGEIQYGISNPVTTNAFGRALIYHKGGPIDVVVEDKDGNILERFTNFGGYVDGDFDLKSAISKDCIDIENPKLRIYDADKCNIPDSFTDPRFLTMWSNWKSGQPIGSYTATKEFFECLGIDFPCGIVVYGNTDNKRYLYNCEDCNVPCPPNPETVEIDEEGNSECWTDVNKADLKNLLSPAIRIRETSTTSTFSGEIDEPILSWTYVRAFTDSQCLITINFDSRIEAEVGPPENDNSISATYSLDTGGGFFTCGSNSLNSGITGGDTSDSVSEVTHISTTRRVVTQGDIPITINAKVELFQGSNVRGWHRHIRVAVIEVNNQWIS